MIRIVAAAALAAFLIYDATTAPGFTGGLEAREQPTRELKGDRLPPRPLESLCSETASPYDRSSCLKRNPTSNTDATLCLWLGRVSVASR